MAKTKTTTASNTSEGLGGGGGGGEERQDVGLYQPPYKSGKFLVKNKDSNKCKTTEEARRKRGGEH